MRARMNERVTPERTAISPTPSPTPPMPRTQRVLWTSASFLVFAMVVVILGGLVLGVA